MIVLRRFVVIGAPIGLGVLAAIHPAVAEDDTPRWMLIHLLQVPLVALLGVAVLVLVDGIPGVPAVASRVALLPWVAAFGAFDGVAGLAVGALADYGQAHPEASPSVAEVSSILVAAWYTEAIGLLAIVSAIVAFGGAALALIGAGASTVGAALIAAGGIVWTVYHPLIGAFAMASFLVGAILVMRSPTAATPH